MPTAAVEDALLDGIDCARAVMEVEQQLYAPLLGPHYGCSPPAVQPYHIPAAGRPTPPANAQVGGQHVWMVMDVAGFEWR